MSEFEILTLQQERMNFILAVIVAIITFLSVLLIYIDYRHRKNKENAEKSISIAEDFANNIIDDMSTICAFFKVTEIDKLIEKVNFMYYVDFDCEELNELYSNDDIERYAMLLQKFDIDHKNRNLIISILNKLEYMCMYISTEVADEKYIYNSLHQQFLKLISILYFEISSTNVDNKDKYYTNIINVYNLWKNKYIKAIKKEDKFKKKQKKEKHKLLPKPKI